MWVVDPDKRHCPVGRSVVEHLPVVQGHVDVVLGAGVFKQVQLALDAILVRHGEAAVDAGVHVNVVSCPDVGEGKGKRVI